MILKIKIDYTALQDDFHFKNIIKTIFILILSLLYLEKLLESTFVLISRTFLLKYLRYFSFLMLWQQKKYFKKKNL